jgi:hypothetical protein
MPVFPFVAGLVVGVAAVRLYKNERLRAEFKDAGKKLRQGGALAEDRVRQAAVSGLGALSGASARLRDRLDAAASAASTAPEAEKEAASTPVKPAVTTKSVTDPSEKPRARRKNPESDAT